MKKLKINILAALIVSGLFYEVNAQTTGNFSSYGGVFVTSSTPTGHFNPMLGGIGGVIYKQKFGFGAFGNAKLGKTPFQPVEQGNTPASELNLKLGYGGLFVEYFALSTQRIRVHTPVKFGYGAVGVYNSADERIEKSRLLVIEPQLHLDVALCKHLAINVHGGYRFTNTNSLQHLANNDISGWGFGVGLLFNSRF